MHSRYNFSIKYIHSAAFFCRQCYDIEQKCRSEKPSAEMGMNHFAYVSNALFSSVSYLEATINELFADSRDDMIWEYEPSQKKTIELFGKMWDLEIPRTAHYPILRKYEIALTLSDKPLFDKGSIPYQNVKSLIQLRNYLVHHAPEWIDAGPAKIPDRQFDEHKFAKIFKGKFNENPLAHHAKAYFPEKCLGHGCAEWTVINCVDFTTKFYQKIGFGLEYENLKESIVTK